MTERLLENWLNNTNERSLMLPFCQLLLSKGYKIFYISTHQQQEAGKDVIAQNPLGIIECFQLKDGDVNLPKFTSIKPELEELLNHPIQHASIPNRTTYDSHLVVNGDIKDPVRTRITELNAADWNQTRSTKLKYFDKQQLLADFLKFFGSFLPSNPLEFKDFIEFYVEDGTELFPLEKFSSLLERYLHIDSLDLRPTDHANLISSSVIITHYCLTPWTSKDNYISQIQAWVCLQAYILQTSEKLNLKDQYWKQSFDLIGQEIDELFNKLLIELKDRKHLIEGDWRPDGVVYKARVTIVLGMICSYPLYRRLRGSPLTQSDEADILSICQTHESKMSFWGEAFTPSFLSYFWFNDLQGNPKGGMERLIVILAALTDPTKSPTPYGFPTPFHSFEESIRLIYGFIKKPQKEHFIGQSYSLWPILGIFVRRKLRKVLEIAWRKISKTQYFISLPQNNWEFYSWRIKKGNLIQKFPPQTQSWLSLLNEFQEENYDNLPKFILDNPYFGMLLIMIFPHRVTPEIIKLIDLSLGK